MKEFTRPALYNYLFAEQGAFLWRGDPCLPMMYGSDTLAFRIEAAAKEGLLQELAMAGYA